MEEDVRQGLISVNEALQHLSIGNAALIREETLSGGLTNDNVLVFLSQGGGSDAGMKKVVLRRFSARTSKHLHYDRQQEYLNSCIASTDKHIGAPVLGLVPSSSHHGGALALDFIEGHTMDEAHIQALCSSEAGLERLVDSIKRIHHGPTLFAKSFDPFSARVIYEEQVRQLSGKGVSWHGYDDLIKQLSPIQAHLTDGSEELVDCHNDLLAANFLDSNDSITIIDWELSGRAEPSWELGNFISENGLDGNEAVVQAIVDRYWAGSCSSFRQGKLERVKLFSIVSKVTWSAWGAVLFHLDRKDEFDYQDWSMKRVCAAQAALTALAASRTPVSLH